MKDRIIVCAIIYFMCMGALVGYWKYEQRRGWTTTIGNEYNTHSFDAPFLRDQYSICMSSVNNLYGRIEVLCRNKGKQSV